MYTCVVSTKYSGTSHYKLKLAKCSFNEIYLNNEKREVLPQIFFICQKVNNKRNYYSVMK